MELEQRASEVNERLSQEKVPADELRAAVRDGKFALVGTWALELPNGRKYNTPQSIEPALAIFDDPEEGIRAYEGLMRRKWPFG